MAQRTNPAVLIKRNRKFLTTSSSVKTSNDEIAQEKTSNRDTSLKSKDDTEILGKGAKKIPNRDRHKIFIEEYLRTLNATQSAIKAGYSPTGARTKGSEL